MLFSRVSIFLGLALSAYAAPKNIEARADVQTRCSKVSSTNAPQGYCQRYDENGVALGGGQACRKASACAVEGNGCILNIYQDSGGWYANCQ